jgi:hypothetical protein
VSHEKDEIFESLSRWVESGHVEIVGVDENGELEFQLTERGIGYVEGLASARGVDLVALKESGASFAEYIEALGQ